MTADTNHTTQPPFKPQTYEEWKAAHGWQPEPEPRLEIGQRVKAVIDIDGEVDFSDDDYPDGDTDSEAAYVEEGTEGTVIDHNDNYGYEVRFDDGVVFWLEWPCYDYETIEPVGKSPSELAYEQSERERLAAYQQLSLFDAAQTGGAS